MTESTATGLPTLRDALKRIREATANGTLVRYPDGASWADGDPFDVPPEGRVHLGDGGEVGIDLPDDGPDGMTYHALGHTLDIEATVRDLIINVVGEVEATNIDIDLVVDRQAGALDVGDQARDGCVTILPDDRVTVWAQGWPHTTDTVPGAWDHFAGKAEQ